jgi:hypothetical protein
LVAVAFGLGLERRQVGARPGLGVADGELDLTAEDLGEVEVLLGLGAELHDRRRHRVERQHREWCPRPLGLVVVDELLDRPQSPAAVLLGPPEAEDAVLTHLADGDPALLAAQLALGHLRLDLGRDDLLEVGAQLLAQRLLFVGQGQPHRDK